MCYPTRVIIHNPCCRWAFFTDYVCEPYVVTTMKVAVGSFWGTVVTSCLTLGFILRPTKIKHVDKEHLCQLQTSDSVVAATRKRWSERLALDIHRQTF